MVSELMHPVLYKKRQQNESFSSIVRIAANSDSVTDLKHKNSKL